MADNGLNQQLEQNMQEQIKIQDQAGQFDEMVKQQKSVFDIEKQNKEVDRADSLQETKNEMKKISEALADKNLQLKDETRAELLTRRNRDMSHIFINSKKFGGDSKEMLDIKEKLLAVENVLAEDFDGKLEFKGNVHNVRKVYLAAITSCNAYLSTKTTYTRSDRYAMVRERLLNLMDELATINDIEAKIIESKQEDDARLVNGYALLTAGRLMAWKADREKEKAQDKPDEQIMSADLLSTLEHIDEEKHINEADESVNKDIKKKRTMDEVGELDYKTETDDTTVQIIKLLKTEAKPKFFSKKASDDATNISCFIYNLIKNFPEGAHTEMIHTGFAGYKGKGNKRTHKDGNGKNVMNNTMLQISQNKDGRLSVTVMKDGKQQVINLPYGRETIVMNMQLDMSEKEEIFGKDALNSTISMIKSANMEKCGTEIRNICLKLLAKYSGHKANDFDNIESKVIRSFTIDLLEGVSTKEDITKAIVEYEQIYITRFDENDVEESDPEFQYNYNAIESTKTERLINNREALELLKMHKKNEKEISSKVSFKTENKEEDKDAVRWNEDEQRIVDFFADFIYSKDTWNSDENINDMGDIKFDLLKKNTRVLSLICVNPNMVIKVMNSALPMPQSSENKHGTSVPTLNSEITKLSVMLVGMMVSKYKMSFFKLRAETVEEKLKEFFNSDSTKDKEDQQSLKDNISSLDDEIEKILESQSKEIEDAVSEKIDGFFKNEEIKVSEEKVANAYEKGISKEEKEKRIKEGNEALNNMLKDSVTGNSGQGLFIRNVFKKYFGGMSAIDKRSMISWILRSSKPSTFVKKTPQEYQKLSNEEREKYDRELNSAELSKTGDMLSGMIKGGGPLFQKIMQGLPTEVLPKEIKDAVEVVKSKLLPIPKEIVDAQLLAMVERSRGEVTKIEVTKSLGAASVGQAFLCKMYGPAYKDGKEVVVKLLRPDARNRMMREKRVMLECARATNEGMESTYLGMLNQIEKELDLTIEASNVEKGDLYSKSSDSSVAMDGVVAMKLENVIAPTTNSIVIEKAEGTTVDSYMKGIDAELLEKLEPFLVYEEKEGRKTVVYEDGIPKLNINYKNSELLGQVKKAIAQMIQTAEKRQKHLITLSEKWVDEGLFGSGFYHGDLHAGNIILNDDKATIIDFGNATQLEEEQKQPVTSMIAAAAVGDWKLFRSCFHSLLPKDKKTEENYQKNRTAFGEQLKYVLNLGSRKDAGQRIGVALVKAQELGLQLPAAIYNFSQCQLRLQNTVNDMNSKIEELRNINDQIDTDNNTLVKDTFDLLKFTDLCFDRLPARKKGPYLTRMINNMKMMKIVLDVSSSPVAPEMEDVVKDIFEADRKAMVGPKNEIATMCEELVDLPDDTIETIAESYIIQLKSSFKKNYLIEYSQDEIEQLRAIFLGAKKGYKDKLNEFFSTRDDFSFDSLFKELNETNKEHYESKKEFDERSRLYYRKRREYLELEDKIKKEKSKEKKEEFKKKKEELSEESKKLKADCAPYEEKERKLREKKEKIADRFNNIMKQREPVISEDANDDSDHDWRYFDPNGSVHFATPLGVYQTWDSEFVTKSDFLNKPDVMQKFIQETDRYVQNEKYGKLFEEKRREFCDFVNTYRENKDNKNNSDISKEVVPYLNKLKLLTSYIFCLELKKKLNNMEEMENEMIKSTVKLDDFTTAMGTVIDKNLMETAKRIGFFWSYTHKDQLTIED